MHACLRKTKLFRDEIPHALAGVRTRILAQRRLLLHAACCDVSSAK
jgi:hypothetical protein